MAEKLPEFWLRGPVPQIIPLLQPVAHALLQAKEEINSLLLNFPNSLLWIKPADIASVGFHLQHIAGVQDRLFTYARGRKLSDEQMQQLKSEGVDSGQTVDYLLQQLNTKFDASLQSLKNFTEDEVQQARGVGRAQLPSTVLGLLFHAAEHTMRHTGQLLVTVKILKQTITPNQ
jgi:uncharacterized damage-inducible protein DinB